MATNKERFIQNLREEIDDLRLQIQAWKEIEADGYSLEIDNGDKLTPGQMMKGCYSRIDELQKLLAKIK